MKRIASAGSRSSLQQQAALRVASNLSAMGGTQMQADPRYRENFIGSQRYPFTSAEPSIRNISRATAGEAVVEPRSSLLDAILQRLVGTR